jgi:hypothetical protein
VHADGDAGHPHGLARRRQARDVAELAERDQRGQLAHPIQPHQRLAAGLATGELAQLALEWGRSAPTVIACLAW